MNIMKAFCLSVPVLLILAAPVPAAPVAEAHYTVINMGDPGESAFIKDWNDAVPEKDIYTWGKSRGIRLLPDRGPVVNDRARFVSRFGSTITLPGLERDRHYTLWVDFVIFKNPEDFNFPTRLEIYVDRRLVRTLNFGDVTSGNNPLRIDIPFDLSADGAVTVLFKEYSTSGGYWGVWDVILTDGDSLPDKIETYRPSKKEMAAKERILEEKRPLKKEKAVRKGEKDKKTGTDMGDKDAAGDAKKDAGKPVKDDKKKGGDISEAGKDAGRGDKKAPGGKGKKIAGKKKSVDKKDAEKIKDGKGETKDADGKKDPGEVEKGVKKEESPAEGKVREDTPAKDAKKEADRGPGKAKKKKDPKKKGGGKADGAAKKDDGKEGPAKDGVVKKEEKTPDGTGPKKKDVRDVAP